MAPASLGMANVPLCRAGCGVGVASRSKTSPGDRCPFRVGDRPCLVSGLSSSCARCCANSCDRPRGAGGLLWLVWGRDSGWRHEQPTACWVHPCPHPCPHSHSCPHPHFHLHSCLNSFIHPHCQPQPCLYSHRHSHSCFQSCPYNHPYLYTPFFFHFCPISSSPSPSFPPHLHPHPHFYPYLPPHPYSHPNPLLCPYSYPYPSPCCPLALQDRPQQRPFPGTPRSRHVLQIPHPWDREVNMEITNCLFLPAVAVSHQVP